jgi:uncharacterized protein HemX
LDKKIERLRPGPAKAGPGFSRYFIRQEKNFMSIFKSNVGRMLGVAVVAAAVGLGTGIALAGQPQMDGALNALQGAQERSNDG